MKKKILSINIDMGMSYNGIYYAYLENNSDEIVADIKDKQGICITLPKNSINYSKESRRIQRHITAGYQRRKLAKRLFDEIIDIANYNQSQQELLHGLFNNRGFSYITVNEEFNEVNEEYIEFISSNNNILNEERALLKGLYTIKDIESLMSNISNEDELLETITTIINAFHSILNAKDSNDNLIVKQKNIQSSLKKIYNIFLNQKKEILLGQKHGKTYFKDIKEIIYKEIDFISIYTKEELYNIICNISNLQLRCLRKYFNGKYYSQFNNKLLGEKLYKFYISRHYNKETIKNKEYLTPFIQQLKVDKDGLMFLKTANPEFTIPPMEDMNNRGSNKCNVLVIKDELITESIKNSLTRIYQKGIFINHEGLKIEDITYFNNDYEKAFRRFADYSLSMIDTTKITPIACGFISESTHPRKVFTDRILNDEYFKNFFFKGYENDYLEFKNLLVKYYQEESNILKGIYTESNSIFRTCGCNSPLKNNTKEILIKSLFRLTHDFSVDDVNTFQEKIYATKIGRKTLYSFLSEISELQQCDKNNFFSNAEYFYNHKEEDNKSEYSFLKDLHVVMEKIADILYNMNKINDNFKEKLSTINDAKSFKNKLNIAKQLFDIIDKDLNGFYKTCKKHTIENEERSQTSEYMEHAVYKRLLSRVAKPIDGMLDMHLNRLAYEIVKNIPYNIAEFSHLEINIEENKFLFEEGLKVVKNGKTPRKKPKKNKSNKHICPYLGTEIKDGDYDHIIPRSSNLGVFNSKANLIYCSQEGNQKIKGSKEYGLWELHEKHLKHIFNTLNKDTILQYIRQHLDTIDVKTFTNFDNLNNHQQNALRYGLYLHKYEENRDIFNKALNILKQDKLKTITNGTQKRLISLIYENILLKNNNIVCSTNTINSILVRAVRNNLSVENDTLLKLERQSNHSHCIDASIVFYLSHSNISDKSAQGKILKQGRGTISFKYDYMKNIYIQDSSVFNIKKTCTFLNLKENKHTKGSLQYFNDTIYSVFFTPFRVSDNKNEMNNIELLINNHLLYRHEKGHKIFIDNVEQVQKNHILYIDNEKYFSLIFNLFENNNFKTLKELQFLDKKICKKTRENVESIFFNDKRELKKYSELEYKTKVTEQLYNRFENEFAGIKDIDNEEWDRKYNKVCRAFFNPHNSKRRRKTKRIYSLQVEKDQANYIVRRKNSIFQALAKSKNISTPTYIVDNNIITMMFYSKNALPIKIKEILNILEYKDKEKIKVTEISIDDISHINPEAKKYINKIHYTFSDSSRVNTRVILNKAAFTNIDFTKMLENNKYIVKDNEVKDLVNNYFNNNELPIYVFLGHPRADNKNIAIIKNTTVNITIEYRKEIKKEFKEILKKMYETYYN